MEKDNKCYKCNTLCTECTNSTEKDCKDCAANATKTDGVCKCASGFMNDASTGKCIPSSTTSSAVYVFTGLLTMLVVLLAIF
jgi:hypothetical protein